MTDDAQVDISYVIGWQAGQSFVQQGLDIEEDRLIEGLRDAMAGSDPKWTPEEMMGALQKLQQDMMAQQQAAAEEQGKVNQEKGAQFLAENGGREGVVTTASGLQFVASS